MDGIPFVSVGLYYDDGLRSLAHSMKENDKESISKAARLLAPLIREGSCIIPAPGRNGYADHTLALAMDDKFYADYLRNDSKQMALDYETKQDTQYCHVYHH